VGGVFGVAILASVFSANGGYQSPATFVNGLVPAVWLGAAVVAVGAVVALAVPALRRGVISLELPVRPAVGERVPVMERMDGR
jgi:hypothetical protein